MYTKSRWKRRYGRRPNGTEVGVPKYDTGDKVGKFTVLHYLGHSAVNKRNHKIMSKAQHWYRCKCECGQQESRSQQELSDTRRQRVCFVCRNQKEESCESILMK
jgi:hypothetical protein